MFPLSLRSLLRRFAMLWATGLLLPAMAVAAPPPAESPARAQEDLDPADWWTSFADDALNELVGQAIDGNHDLATAGARVRTAQGMTTQAASPLLPTVGFDVGLNASPSSASSFAMSPELNKLIADLAAYQDLLPSDPDAPAAEDSEEDPALSWNGSASLRFGLRIDPGASVAGLKSARLAAAAARGDRDAVARLVVQQVVTTWLDLRTAGLRLALLQEQEAAHDQLLALIRARYTSGLTGALDVLRQEQQVAAARSQLPRGRQTQQLLVIRLGVLLGQGAERGAELIATVTTEPGLPQLPPSPGLGAPGDLLQDRPDLKSAQLRYDAAVAKQTSSALAFAPSLALSANVGLSLRHYGEWDTQEAYGFGATLQVPIFGGLARVGALQQSVAAKKSAGRTLSALSQSVEAEVASARATEGAEVERLDALRVQLAAAESAYLQSVRSYEAGLTDYLSVLTTLGVWQQTQLSHLQARRDVLVARVDLHSALGSRWTYLLRPTRVRR